MAYCIDMFNVKSQEESHKSSALHSPLPSQGALCNRSERLEDNKCVMQPDRDHGSKTNSTTVKNRDLHEISCQFALQITVEIYSRLLRTSYKSLMICVNCEGILPRVKCDIQRLLTSQIYSLFVCGDVELNPGPTTPVSVLTSRLADTGRSACEYRG